MCEGPALEVVHPGVSAAEARYVLFDFDGTLSLIRAGWMELMVSMMLEVLNEGDRSSSEAALRPVVESFILRLTGRETIYQMMELAEEVRRRGGVPLDPQIYKERFLARLRDLTGHRIEELRNGCCEPDRYLVPGARRLLEALKARNLTLYLASGTDDAALKQEAELLDIARYFDGRIYGALEDERSFSKQVVVRQIAGLPGARGCHLLAFGDGAVEIEEVRRVGGLAVGVATDEPECRTVDERKRRQLMAAGADFIIGNYLNTDALVDALFQP